jgi:hypothetical protein
MWRSWPYGCNVNFPSKVNFMCNSSGGCYYSIDLEDKGPPNYCVFKGPGVMKGPLVTPSPISDAPSTQSPTEHTIPCKGYCVIA